MHDVISPNCTSLLLKQANMLRYDSEHGEFILADLSDHKSKTVFVLTLWDDRSVSKKENKGGLFSAFYSITAPFQLRRSQ